MDENEIKEKLEETVSFQVGDKTIYGVLNYDGSEYMATISGYDLQISFNMRLINSLADAEACANSIADVFYQTLMNQLIEIKANLINLSRSE